ncbi:lipase family protein [Chromobacterium subtsugae]|uniref:lipase family protein n=1 Tax=Chromobacterium subtsugae TaxID=251747 RepID=UPI0009B9B792|nr:lipase family protein [Chromobacterium subtsugae]
MDRTAAAKVACNVLYAENTCLQNGSNISQIPPEWVDPRIEQSNLTIVGWVVAADAILKTALSSGTKLLDAGDDWVCYGYVAKSADGYVIAIRGTEGIEEWLDDADCIMKPRDAGEYVEGGFWEIYRSLRFISVGSGLPYAITANWPPQALSDLTNLIQGEPVIIVAHSLGSAIAAFLAYDLKSRSVSNISACLFACPKLGNEVFVNGFVNAGVNYDVFNYERDIVPQLPPVDILHLTMLHQIPGEKIIPASDCICNDAGCNHHLICYIALLDQGVFEGVMKGSPTADDLRLANCVNS